MLALAGSALALTGTLFVAYMTRKTARENQRASPYEALAARVVVLEESSVRKAVQLEQQAGVIRKLQALEARQAAHLGQLREEVGTLVDHVLVVQAWIDLGMPPPPPLVPDTVQALVRRLRGAGHPPPPPL